MNENTKATLKDWAIFIVWMLLVFGCGFTCGFKVGRNHPSVDAEDRWLSDIREEVRKLNVTYLETIDEYKTGIQIRDSIIYTLKREIAKGEDVDLPIYVNINVKEDGGSF